MAFKNRFQNRITSCWRTMSSGPGVALRDCLGEMGFNPEQISSALRALGNDCSVEDAALFILASRDDEGDRYNDEIPPLVSIHPPESKMMLVVREDLGQSQPSRACAAPLRVRACGLSFAHPGMSAGKIGSQCAHAALGCERLARARAPSAVCPEARLGPRAK